METEPKTWQEVYEYLLSKDQSELIALELKAIREEINHLARIQKAQNDILLRILRAH